MRYKYRIKGACDRHFFVPGEIVKSSTSPDDLMVMMEDERMFAISDETGMPQFLHKNDVEPLGEGE